MPYSHLVLVILGAGGHLAMAGLGHITLPDHMATEAPEPEFRLSALDLIKMP